MIKVTDYINNAFSMEDAEKLIPAIEKELASEDQVVLDFSGIKYFTTLFFNNAVTKYVIELGADEYKKKFSLIRLSDVGESTYEHSLDNAISYSDNV